MKQCYPSRLGDLNDIFHLDLNTCERKVIIHKILGKRIVGWILINISKYFLKDAFVISERYHPHF